MESLAEGLSPPARRHQHPPVRRTLALALPLALSLALAVILTMTLPQTLVVTNPTPTLTRAGRRAEPGRPRQWRLAAATSRGGQG